MSALSATLWINSIPTYKLTTLRWAAFLTAFVTLAVGTPHVCHQFGLAGTIFLPIHFAVIFAAMVMGTRGGILTAMVSPIISFGLSGMPPAHILATMTIELMAYAGTAGWLVHNRKMSLIASLVVTMIVGRFLAIGINIFGFGATMSLAEKARILFIVGLPGIIIQILLLPPMAAKIGKYLSNE